jgi:3-phosphoshikimate 1-carboxyvinyltransferase
MGAEIEAQEAGTPPLKIKGGQLHGIVYDMPMASAQVKSCLLLAGLYAQGRTTVTEPASCRDHTERMLKGFGYPVDVAENGTVSLEGGHELQAMAIDVPGDISSAAFFLVAAAITPGSDLTLRHVGVNPTRTGVINILVKMGARLELLNESLVGGEPVADIRIQYSELKGIDIPEAEIPLAIDEFPVLFIAAANARGTTTLRGAEELRVKESDRIEAMAQGLTILGISNEVYPDGIKIEGGRYGGGEINSHGDHRIAMAFSIAALRASAAIRILNCNNVATSFPGFVELAATLGLGITANE